MQSTLAIRRPAPMPAPFRDTTPLFLVPHPGEEDALCGGLIAQCCARGRPPYVVVLCDGAGGASDDAARARERQSRAAAAALGLDSERLLFVRVHDGTLPAAGPLFEALVRAVILLMWARDLGTVCAPHDGATDPDHRAAHAIAREASARSGVALGAFDPRGAGEFYDVPTQKMQTGGYA